MSTATATARAIAIIDISIERAYEIADQLSSKSQHIGSSTTTFSGIHPEHGPIHVVIPPLGDAIILPLVVQNVDI